MTLEKQSFEGLMSSLNLEEFPTYEIHNELNYNQLSIIKNNLEIQLTRLFEILQDFKCDMETPLIINGFPRDDIDVVSVRLIRVKIIRLRNDHKYLLSLIEEKLINQFNNPDDMEPSKVVEIDSDIPFAIIDEVIDQSPSHKAGLKKGDKIVKFDKDINAMNNDKLMKLVHRVKTKVNEAIEIDILRNERIIVELVPTDQWDGKGLLGCKILPI
ncbi:probable 26S proteasome regulatory subunit p27 [[Candida] jaroonii]|uniref:Probable 26S proteasome regulatory subunit p27 n=1 Tax=[Candida] jaroonii TaxID=467808 RepID=A0ACA9YAL5_9ASCO|nr:probable 26S proteasome regulatory subunit p27 [[Candida] jaroonii]